jgi:hypothetical protein
MKLWKHLFHRQRPEPSATGIRILIMQKRLDRFSTERLNAAMQRGWHRAHDTQAFFAKSIFDGDGAVLKVGKSYVTMQHFDRKLGRAELGDCQLPSWAASHSGYSSVEYKCREGVPEGDDRDRLYAFLGLLCAELISENTFGLFFVEERIAIPNSPVLRDRLRSSQSLNPRSFGELSA